MSSPSPTEPDHRRRRASGRSPAPPGHRRRAPVALLAVVAVVAAGAGPAVAAPAPLPVAAVLTAGGHTSLVVDLGASGRTGSRTVSVTNHGVPLRADLIPVMSDGLAVALVVDTATAGAAILPAWLSAAARFILEAPPTTRTAVITAGAPAAVVPSQPRPSVSPAGGEQQTPGGPVDRESIGAASVVRLLDQMRAGGDRDTAAALALAAGQFPATQAGRRLIVLYTTAPDAGGESGAALGNRLRATGTILVVVGTAAAGRFWSTPAEATGGFFAPAEDPVVVPALDQVETTLHGRYLVRFPTPTRLPAQVAVRIDTADLTLTGSPTVPAPVTPGRPRWTAVHWAVISAALLLLLFVLAVAAHRGRARPSAAAPPLVRTPIARARATVPRRDGGSSR